MKKSTQFFIILVAGIMMISCGQSTNSNESGEAEEKSETSLAQDVDQLTYQDVVAMVYDDEGEGIEWHGEEMPNELVDFLILNRGEPCGEGDCGTRVVLVNISDQSITTVIRGDYDIEGDQGYIPRKYIVAASDTLMIGCSHLCYGGKGYEFPRTIVASSYTEME